MSRIRQPNRRAAPPRWDAGSAAKYVVTIRGGTSELMLRSVKFDQAMKRSSEEAAPERRPAPCIVRGERYPAAARPVACRVRYVDATSARGDDDGRGRSPQKADCWG